MQDYTVTVNGKEFGFCAPDEWGNNGPIYLESLALSKNVVTDSRFFRYSNKLELMPVTKGFKAVEHRTVIAKDEMDNYIWVPYPYFDTKYLEIKDAEKSNIYDLIMNNIIVVKSNTITSDSIINISNNAKKYIVSHLVEYKKYAQYMGTNPVYVPHDPEPVEHYLINQRPVQDPVVVPEGVSQNQKNSKNNLVDIDEFLGNVTEAADNGQITPDSIKETFKRIREIIDGDPSIDVFGKEFIKFAEVNAINSLNISSTNNNLLIPDPENQEEATRQNAAPSSKLVRTVPVTPSNNPEDWFKEVLNFDYTALLAKYDIKAINKSVIKYYQAVQQWTNELMNKLDGYEQENESLIRDFNMISLKLSKKYEDNPHLTDAENTLLAERQHYFQKSFSLELNKVKSNILSIQKQADDLEYRIDEINNGEDAIHELALLEKEERVSFEFIAENTAEIIKNALLKIEYFQNNHQFIMNAVNIWEKWTENYRVFKTTYREDLKASCENDSIEEEIWNKWYENWQNIRFAIEQKIKPILERGLKSSIPTVAENKVSVPELLVMALDKYKGKIDQFFLEDRKGIYQKFVFQTGGELQDKFETESELYKCTASLQSDLQEIIFCCANAGDRIFILKWANSLLDIQIDEIIDFIADNDLQEISQTILSEFAALKQKNYDIYLADAKAYSEEKSRREKEYNALIFKMRKDLRKDLMKQ